MLTHSMQNSTKAIKILVILISWELWCERKNLSEQGPTTNDRSRQN